MIETSEGQLIEVQDAFGNRLRRVALGPVDPGYDFAVVWACREEEWQSAKEEDREPESIPWPIEDVTIIDKVPA